MSRNLIFTKIFGGSITVLATILGVSAPANAIVFTTFTDRPSWEAAVGGSFSEEDFNSFTVDTSFNSDGSVNVGNLSLNGVGNASFNRIDVPPYIVANPNINVNGTSQVSSEVNSIGTAFLNIAFSSEITAFGAEFASISDGRITQIVADSEVPISVPEINSTEFFGIVGDGSFSNITFQPGDNQTDGFGMDNVVYFSSITSVPFEFSPTLGLFAVGGIWGVSRLRKKMSASKITE